jgi:hypothetical protein
MVHTPNARYAAMVHDVGGDVWEVASLDLRRLIGYPLGRVTTGWIVRCQVTATHLACPTRGFEIEIWRYAG